MKINAWDQFLVVDSSLANVTNYFGMVMFNAKMLKDIFKKNNKHEFSYTENKLEDILEKYITDADGKNAIIIENKNQSATWDGTQTNGIGIYTTTSFDHASKQYQIIKKELLAKSPSIVPVYEVIKPNLRSTVVQYFFRHEILPSISKEMIDYCNGRDSVAHVQYSWSYIASFKKKLLGEYVDKELYWIRLIYNKEAEKLIADNIGDTRKMAKTKDLKVFYPSPYQSSNIYGKYLEYIDIFTTDSTIGHFFTLTADKTTFAFAAELTSLVKNLQELELLNV